MLAPIFLENSLQMGTAIVASGCLIPLNLIGFAKLVEFVCWQKFVNPLQRDQRHLQSTGKLILAKN